MDEHMVQLWILAYKMDTKKYTHIEKYKIV